MILPTPEEGAPGPRDPDAWVAVETYGDLMAAELARARLALADLEARVFDGNMGLLAAYNPAIGGIRLMVRASDLEAARAALADHDVVEAEDMPDADDISLAAHYCSVCHSTDIEVEERRTAAEASFFTRLRARMFGPSAPLRCRRCGHTWTE